MDKIYNILKNFDIYGYNFRLRYKKEIEYSTFCGIFFSLISISIILTISISHISKMVNGTNFSVVTNYIYTYNNIEIDLSSYPLLFGLYKTSQNLTIRGHYGDQINGFNTLKFHLIKCKNSSENNNHCKSSEEIDKYLENTYVSLFMFQKLLIILIFQILFIILLIQIVLQLLLNMLKDIIIFFLKKNILLIMELFLIQMKNMNYFNIIILILIF